MKKKKKGIYLHKRWIPFSETCTNILAIYGQEDVNSRRGPSDRDLVCSGHSVSPPPLLAASQALRAPESFSRRHQRRVKKKGPSAQCTGPWGEDRSRSILPSPLPSHM